MTPQTQPSTSVGFCVGLVYGTAESSSFVASGTPIRGFSLAITSTSEKVPPVALDIKPAGVIELQHRTQLLNDESLQVTLRSHV